MDINPDHLRSAAAELDPLRQHCEIRLLAGDFFVTDWPQIVADLPHPILVVGNPPWVTNSQLAEIASGNIPVKVNFHNRSGIEALTGKSNFDISEWMLLRLLELLQSRDSVLAMLCKTAVARKVLATAWSRGWRVGEARLFPIDAKRHFHAAVDASLFVVSTGVSEPRQTCQVHTGLDVNERAVGFGIRDGDLIANLELFDRWQHLQGNRQTRWRSGVKHDCADVFELHREGRRFRNRGGELIEL